MDTRVKPAHDAYVASACTQILKIFIKIYLILSKKLTAFRTTVSVL